MTKDEKTYSILPHPAKTNDPTDLQPSDNIHSSGGMGVFHARDPFIPTEEMKQKIPLPASEEELQARQAELNALNTENAGKSSGEDSNK